MEAARPALIFIPDISGFTRFVAETEARHARHIIRELLEILIDSNRIGLEVSEVEGDAVLFYRFGNAPAAEQLLDQVRQMFVAFHRHLKRYERHRICPCGACRTAHDLTLKIVAHYGEVALNPVGAHTKLFGTAVIVAHRLMKNAIPLSEYALFTDTLVQACPSWENVPAAAWADAQEREETYDAGPVTYCFLPLAPLLDQVEEADLPDPIFKGRATKVLERARTFIHPAETVFRTVIDLPRRVDWFYDAVGIEWVSPHRINRVGTKHRCIYEHIDSTMAITTEGFREDETSFRFSEVDEKGMLSITYIFETIDERTSRFRVECRLKDGILPRLVYGLLIRKKLVLHVESSLARLDEYLNRPDVLEHPPSADA